MEYTITIEAPRANEPMVTRVNLDELLPSEMLAKGLAIILRKLADNIEEEESTYLQWTQGEGQ